MLIFDISSATPDDSGGCLVIIGELTNISFERQVIWIVPRLPDAHLVWCDYVPN